jgi:hypothetical protein
MSLKMQIWRGVLALALFASVGVFAATHRIPAEQLAARHAQTVQHTAKPPLKVVVRQAAMLQEQAATLACAWAPEAPLALR